MTKSVHVVRREETGITVEIKIECPGSVDRQDAWILYREAVVQAERELMPLEELTIPEGSRPVKLDYVQGSFGSDWTGGMDSVDWVRAQRDD